jgi:hypothetical protein
MEPAVVKIIAPGIYKNFPTADYFADPCPEPSFTQSLAKILLDRSPLHAFQAHPRLYVPTIEEDEGYEKNRAIGNAAHAILLGRGKALEIGEYPDFRTKAAQAFKAAAIENGKEPILQHHYKTAQDMAAEAFAQLQHIAGCSHAFDPIQGDAEVVIASCEDGLWLRSMVDWITTDLREVWDVKTTGQSCSPWASGKLMASAGWHIQAAFHERILDDVDPAGAGRRRFLYVAQENSEPYALTVNEISESALTIGRKQVDHAIRIWRDCIENERWPAYPPRIIVPELPGYTENACLSRELAEASENDPSLIFAG